MSDRRSHDAHRWLQQEVRRDVLAHAAGTAPVSRLPYIWIVLFHGKMARYGPCSWYRAWAGHIQASSFSRCQTLRGGFTAGIVRGVQEFAASRHTCQRIPGIVEHCHVHRALVSNERACTAGSAPLLSHTCIIGKALSAHATQRETGGGKGSVATHPRGSCWTGPAL